MKLIRTLILTLFICFSAWLGYAQSWTALNGPTGGTVTSLVNDGNGRIYALVNEGGDIFASSNGGSTWANITSSLNYVHGLTVDGNTLYANTWSDIYSSSNGGVNWNKVNQTNTMQFLDLGMTSFKVGNTLALFAYGNLGAWISMDAGVNWKKIYSSRITKAANTSTGDLFAVAPSVGILRHPFQADVNGWDQSKWLTIQAKENASDDYAMSVGVNQNNADKLFIGYLNAAGSTTIYKTSTNGGSTFSLINAPENTANAHQLWISGPGRFYCIIGSSIYAVTDGSLPTFTKKTKPGNSGYNVRALLYRNISEIYMGVDGDGVWKSTDDINTVAASNGVFPSAIVRTPLRDIEVIGSRLIAIPFSNANGYWTSTNDGANWSWNPLSLNIPTFGNKKIFERIQDGSLIITTSGSGTQRSSDGLIWSQVSTEAFDDYVTVGSTEVFGFRGNTNPVMKATVVSGSWTWTPVTITGYPTNITNVEVAAYDGANFYVAMMRAGQIEYWKVILTGPSSGTASKMTVPLRTDAYSCAGLFVFKGKLYIGDYFKIAISDNQGASFSKVLESNHNRIFPINQKSGGIGISTNGALLITKDDGITFSSTTIPSTDAHILNIAAPNGGDGDTYAATYGSPVLKFALKDSLIRNTSSPYIDFGWQKMEGPTGGGSGRRLFKSSTNQLFADGWSAVHRFNTTTNKWEQLDKLNLNNHGMFHDGTNIYQMRWDDLYKSTDGGNTFTLQSRGQFRNSNGNGYGLFKSSSGSLFVLSYGDGLYRSVNDGVTFTQVKSSGTFVDLAQSGNVLIAVYKQGNSMVVERSTNDGLTWTTAQSGLTFSDAKESDMLTTGDNGTFILTTFNDIFRTTDGGLTWGSIKSNLPETQWCCSSKTYIAPNGDYYFYNWGYPGKLYVSTNQGGSWVRKNPNTTGTPFNDISDLIWVGNRIYALAGFSNGIMFSDDGGATFTIFNSNNGFNGFRDFTGGDIRITNGKITIANAQALSVSNDTGVTWSNVNNNVSRLLDLPNGDIIAYEGVILRSTDGGSNWTKIKEGSFAQFILNNGSNFIIIGNITGCCASNFYTSTDLVTWTPFQVTGIPNTISGFGSAAAFGNKTYISGFNNANNLYETYEVSSGIASKLNLSLNLQQVIARNDRIYILSREGFLFESTDGIAWVKRSLPVSLPEKLIFANNGYLFLTSAVGYVSVSRDGGLSWQNVSASNVNSSFGDIAVDLATGLAYGTHASKPLFKSARIVVPDDKAGPTIGALTPANGATNVSKSNFKLVITFNEGAKAVNDKNLRIFSATNSTTPVETIPVKNGVTTDNRITFTPTFTPNDLGVYYVTIDAGSFTDFYNNASLALSDVNAWRFTMADATPPAITFTTSNIEKGSAKAFEATIIDNGGIANQKITLFHRNITSAATAPFTSVAMTAQAGGTATNSRFVTTGINETDGMGLEFYIEAEDIAGNKSRSPATANTFHYSYITYPVANRPSLNSVVTFGGSADTYRIISVPYKLENASISTILDELGPADKKNWRLLTYAGTAGTQVNWQEFDGQSGLTNFARGKGYWFNAKNETSLLIEGASSPENNRTSFFKMSLQQGWNQIGNPYPVAINWTEVIAGTNGIGQLKKFAGGAYSNATTLNPLEGGFVFVSGGAQEVTVRFPGITTGGREEKTTIISDLGAESWELPLAIEQGELKNELSGIGMNKKASLNFDSFDDLNMPLFEGLPQTEIQFEKQHGEMRVLAKDVVPTQDEFVWQFKLISNRGEQTTFRWSNSDFGANNKELYLLDEGTQQLTNMREVTSYSFNPSQSKSFKIYFGDNLKSKIKPGKNHLGKAYPNPASDQVSIPFALSDRSSSYAVRLEIYNAQGAKVAVLHEGNLAPGFYTKGWNTSESHLNNGLYIVRMAVSGVEGQEVQTEKIIINN